MLSKRAKDQVIAKFKTHKNDTGSASVQIALLTKEIELLTEHLRTHKKDFSSRRGLIKKVSQRRRLLKFLELDNEKECSKVIKKLGLRRPARITAVEDDIRQEEAQIAAEQEAIAKEEEKPEETE